MKKRLLILTALMGTLTAQADDYPFLTFELADGTKTSVAASSLSLTISGTTLTAGSQSFTLTNLSKMYFSTTDESSTSGIKSVSALTTDEWESAEIYDLQGRRVTREQMRQGIYVVKTTSGTFKVNVK